MRRIRKIAIITILVALLLMAGAIKLYAKRSALKAELKRYGADHIVFFQSVKKISNALFWPQAFFGKNQLETHYLEIAPAELQKLNDNLPKGNYTELAAQDKLYNALTGKNELWVPAVFVYNGAQYDVEVGYWDGQIYLHWFYPQKSWQIRFTADSPFDYQQFFLIVPHDRSYLGEQLNQFRAKELGLITPATGYVNLFVNNDRHGVYYMIENWSEQTLARNRRSPTGCIFGSNKVLAPGLARPAAYDQVGAWQEYTNRCGAAGLAKLQTLLNLLKLEGEPFREKAQNLLAINQVLRWNALNRLAGSRQGLPDNLRVYWDDTTNKFEFLPWDFSLAKHDSETIDKPYNEFITRLLEVPAWQARRNELLREYLDNQNNLTEDLAYYDDLVKKTKIAFYQDNKKNDSNLKLKERVKEVRGAIIYNWNKLSSLLKRNSLFSYANLNSPIEVARIETEDGLTLPVEKKDEVWAYLVERFVNDKEFIKSLDPKFSSYANDEQFADVYFDTSDLKLLAIKAGVRHRTRLNLTDPEDRKSGRELVQIKISHSENGGFARGEIKFEVERPSNPKSADDKHPLIGLIKTDQRAEFKNVLTELGLDPYVMKPILVNEQLRRRIYLQRDNEPFISISLDLSTFKRDGREAQLAEIEPELNEVVYTEASAEVRRYMEKIGAAIVNDIWQRFPYLVRDLVPKYNQGMVVSEAKQ